MSASSTAGRTVDDEERRLAAAGGAVVGGECFGVAEFDLEVQLGLDVEAGHRGDALLEQVSKNREIVGFDVVDRLAERAPRAM